MIKRLLSVLIYVEYRVEAIGATSAVIGIAAIMELTQKTKKHDQIRVLADAKLNTIDKYVSHAIEDGDISQEEFVLISSELKKFNEMEEDGKYAGSTYVGFGWAKQPKGSRHASTYTVTWIQQLDAVILAWWDFVPKKSSLTDVKTQAQTKTSVMAPGTGLDAQRQFITVVESLINSAPDLKQSIDQFQDSPQYTKMPLNFVVAPSLYLVPSDMDLCIGMFEGCNNKLRSKKCRPVTRPSLNTGGVSASDFDNQVEEKEPSPKILKSDPIPNRKPILTPTLERKPIDPHNEEKLSLTVGTVAVAAVAFMLH